MFLLYIYIYMYIWLCIQDINLDNTGHDLNGLDHILCPILCCYMSGDSKLADLMVRINKKWSSTCWRTVIFSQKILKFERGSETCQVEIIGSYHQTVTRILFVEVDEFKFWTCFPQWNSCILFSPWSSVLNLVASCRYGSALRLI